MSIDHVIRSAGGPRDDSGPVFAEPWQADAFAMVIALTDAGVFTAAEWSEALGAAIRSAQAAGDPDLGDTYYHHWVAALESLCTTRAEIVKAAIDECQNDWRRAYENTAHGQSVERRDEQSREAAPDVFAENVGLNPVCGRTTATPPTTRL